VWIRGSGVEEAAAEEAEGRREAGLLGFGVWCHALRAEVLRRPEKTGAEAPQVKRTEAMSLDRIGWWERVVPGGEED